MLVHDRWMKLEISVIFLGSVIIRWTQFKFLFEFFLGIKHYAMQTPLRTMGCLVFQILYPCSFLDIHFLFDFNITVQSQRNISHEIIQCVLRFK